MGQERSVWRVRLALIFALVFPTALAVVYTMGLPAAAEGPNAWLQAVYAARNVVMFALPVVCVWLFERRLPRPALPTWRGLAYGVGFGLLVTAGMLALYAGLLRDTPLFEHPAERFRREMREFGLASPAGFVLFAFFITVLHSLLEEYYWRWFVFGWLERYASFPAALLLSSLGFMAHHVVLLAEYFPDYFLVAAVPFGLCTAVGGAVWAWLYHRTGSLYAPWLSHLLVDVGLFVIGYDLYFGAP
jgi:uncharacterized protein